MNTPDTLLIERWQKLHDADAFTELTQRYAGLVYAACKRVLNDAALAEDVAQECFIELMQSSDRIRVSLGAWLHTMAVRRSIDRIKGDSRRRQREQRYAEDGESTTIPDAALSEILSCVDEAISALPHQYQQVVIARFLEGQSHVEVGQQLGLSESAIRYRIDKAISTIRTTLRKQGIVVGVAALTTALTESAQAAPTSLLTRLGKLSLSGAVAGGAAQSIGMGLLSKAVVALLILGGVGSVIWLGTSDGADKKDVSETTIATVESVPSETPSSETTRPDLAGAAGESDTVDAVIAEEEPFVLRGRVLDADTGEGVAGIRVQLSPTGGGSVQYPDKKETGSDGKYIFSELAPGAWSVYVQEPTKYPRALSQQRIAVILEEGERKDNVDFFLKAGIRVSGRVLDAEGNPVSKAKVGAKAADAPNPYRAESDAEGQYAVYLPEATDKLLLRAHSETAISELLKNIQLPQSGLDNLDITLDIPRTASVSGRIADVFGNGVGGANIYLYREGKAIFITERQMDSTRSGRFHIKDCAPGDYAVIVTPEGANGFSGSDDYARISLGVGEELKGLDILFGDKGGEAIAGRVLDPEGKPLRNVEVTAFGTTRERTQTDREGKFLISGLEKDAKYSVEVRSHGYYLPQQRVKSGTLDLKINMQEPGHVHGQVVYADTGEPMQEFSMDSIHGKTNSLYASLYTHSNTIKNEKGEFAVRKRPSGTTTIAVWAPGHGVEVKSVEIQAGKTIETTIQLHPVEAISGRVVDNAGEPVSFANIFFAEGFATYSIEQSGMVDSNIDGYFNLTSYPKDIKRISAYKSGYGIGTMELPGNGVITLPKTVTIKGVVHNSPAPAVQTNINYHYKDQRHLLSDMMRPEDDYHFENDALSPGELTVSVYSNLSMENKQTIQQTFTAEAGKTYPLEYRFERGTASLEVTLMEGEAPIGRSWVKLSQVIPGGSRSLRSHQLEPGTFRFSKVWAGPVTLEVTRYATDDTSEHDKYSIDYTLTEGESLKTEIDLNTID